MSSSVIPLDVPGLGVVHFLRLPVHGNGGRVIRTRPAGVLWPDGRELSQRDSEIAMKYWGEHPELHNG